MTPQQLVNRYPIITNQVDAREILIILTELDKLLAQGNIPGDIVELGCYAGTTSLFIQRLLQDRQATRQFHVYDSFEGLPAKTSQDNSAAGDQFRAGELSVGKAKFIKHFRQAGLSLPVIHKLWFKDITPDDLPSQISFAFLDGDFYESIRDSLNAIEPLMTGGGVIIVDDYQSEALPGAQRAVEEWLEYQNGWQKRVIASLAVLVK